MLPYDVTFEILQHCVMQLTDNTVFSNSLRYGNLNTVCTVLLGDLET